MITVSVPDGRVLRKEFDAGSSAFLDLIDDSGNLLPDGQYTYELRVIPVVDPALRKALAAARESGDPSTVQAVLRKYGLDPKRGLVQSGYFWIANGLIVHRTLREP